MRHEGAVIEIIERVRPGEDAAEVGVIVPNEVRINGQRLLVSRDHPIVVHEMAVTLGESVAVVTLTLLAKRVTVGAEESEVPVIRDAVGNVVHVGQR